MTVVHLLKTSHLYFYDVLLGSKAFEIRKDDRDPAFQVNDLVCLVCLDSYGNVTTEKVICKITYILRNVPEYGLSEGHAILGIQKINFLERVLLTFTLNVMYSE